MELRPPVGRGFELRFGLVDRSFVSSFHLRALRTFARHAAVAVDNVRVHEEAQRLSLTDPLTGLWNYRYLTESIRREVERASRFGRMLSVLALDLDRFKEVNDTYGHRAGDQVLQIIARRLRSSVRDGDIVARWGGDEFVVLLPGVVSTEMGARRARQLAEEIAGRTRIDGVADSLRIGTSVGVALWPQHGEQLDDLIVAADHAMYAAKRMGKGREVR